VDIHLAVRDVVDQLGVGVLDDADNFRGVLDDVLDEDVAEVGQVNLLTDAVRFGAVDQLERLLDSAADPGMAVATVGEAFGRVRGGADPRAAGWACAVLGFAIGRVPEDVVRALQPRPERLAQTVLPPSEGTRIRPESPDTVHTGPSPDQQSDPTEPRRGGRRALAGVVALAAVAAIVVAVWSFSRSDPPSTSEAEPEPTTASTSAPGAVESSEPGPAPTATCWNGHPVASIRQCTEPNEVRGLSWVFPSSDDDSCEHASRAQATRVINRYCPVSLPGGSVVQLHYSQWREHSWMVDNYEADQAGAAIPLGREDLRAFEVKAPELLTKVVAFYRSPAAPFSVTVYSESLADALAALNRAQFRAIDQLSGLELDDEELPVAVTVQKRIPVGRH
jgi:hypothetical protein